MARKYKRIKVDPYFDEQLSRFTLKMNEKTGKKISKLRATGILAYFIQNPSFQVDLSQKNEVKRRKTSLYPWEY